MAIIPSIHRAMLVLRAKHGKKQFECAQALGVSSSQLSNIEYGRQNPPETFIARMREFMGLNETDVKVLINAVRRAKTSFRIDDLDPQKREDVAILYSAIRELNQEELDNLKARYSLTDVGKFDLSFGESKKHSTQLAAPISFREISRISSRLRQEAGDFAPGTFMEFFENRLHEVIEGFTFSIVPKALMRKCSGATFPNLRHIAIREDIYEYAHNGGLGSQFVIAHEIGHVVLHEFISSTPAENAHDYPVFYHAEWQANKFAQCLLVPPQLIERGDTVETVSRRLQVSPGVVEVQIGDCRRRGLV